MRMALCLNLPPRQHMLWKPGCHHHLGWGEEEEEEEKDKEQGRLSWTSAIL